MKFFAANLLADAFGREFGALDPREIECKCQVLRQKQLIFNSETFPDLVFVCNLTYVILRELDLLKHPNLSLRHLAQDGVFGKLLCFLSIFANPTAPIVV